MTQYTDAVRMQALELWCEGRSFVQVGRDLSIPSATVRSWYVAKAPVDWDLYLQQVQRSAQNEVLQRLVGKRAQMIEQHFNDLEKIRQAVMLSVMEPVHQLAKDESGKMVPVVRDDGQPVVLAYRHRRDQAPKDVRDAANAYKQVQHGQRLALGIPTDYQVTASAETHSGDPKDALREMGIGDEEKAALGLYAARLMRPEMVEEGDEDDVLEALAEDDG